MQGKMRRKRGLRDRLPRAERLEKRVVLAAFSVTTTADSGPGSLRQAILDSNAAGSIDDINFGATFSTPQTISLQTALPAITDFLSIHGTGAQNLIIRRAPSAVGLFHILAVSAPTSLFDLTITEGNDGGIVVDADGVRLALFNSVVTGNTSAKPGGGISVGNGSFLTVINSTVSGNTSAGPGGGIYFFQNGGLLMDSSTVSGNTSTSSNGAGGIYFFGIPDASPPSGFTANTLVVRNSTIANNAATAGPGGGVRLAQFGGQILLQDSTVTGNTSAGGAGGGGVQKDGGGNVTLTNSIVSGNTSAAAPDISSDTTVDVLFSAVGSSAGFTLGATSQNVPFGADLKLSPLGNFGGPTQTIYPGIGSPVIDAGSSSLASGLTTDQRGTGFPRMTGPAVDIGAIERDPNIQVVTNANDSGAGSLRDAITTVNFTGSNNVGIAFDPTFFSTPRTISLLSALPTLANPFTTIFGPGQQKVNVTRAAGAPDFAIFNSTASTLNLFGMRISGGTAGGVAGGGTSPNVTLDSVAVTGNSGGIGGGVSLGTDSFLTVRNSTIADNAAASGGGIGFLNRGSLVLENSTISGNSATGATSRGGGIYFFGVAAANPPLGFSPSTLTVRNSTIANNTSGSVGGGFAGLNFSGALFVLDSTVARNSAAVIGGGLLTPAGAITLANSIVSGNTTTGGSQPDVSAGTAVNANFSAIGSNDGFFLSDSSGNNVPFGADLKLSPLGNFGGPTQTIVPGSITSPVVSGGSAALVPAGVTTDQRGAGFIRINGTIDIGAAEAQNYLLVNTTSDSGLGSLRQAITDANTSPAFDTIIFDPSVFNQQIVLQSALPTITGQLTIFGPGKDLLTVRRNPFAGTNFSVFDSTATVLNLFGMTVTDGNSGALTADGTTPNVTLDSVVFSSNTGSAVGVGGGGSLAVRNSTLSGNSAFGGAGILLSAGGSLVVENSTISGNSAAGGGGVYFNGTASANPPVGFTPSTLVIRNSTIAKNTATGGAGGVGLAQLVGTLLIQNSTITGNSADITGGGVLSIGSGTVILVNTIVSGNTSANGSPDIESGSAVKANFSAIGSNTGFAFAAGSGNNLAAGTNLLLGPLADNGGPTQTIKPKAVSPLLGAGSNALVPAGAAFDQRGAGFARIVGNVDIGAVESRDPIVVTSTADSGAGTLRDAITQANAAAGDDTITFGGAAFASPQTISLLSDLPLVTDSLTIAGNTTAQNLIIRRAPGAATQFRILNSSATSLELSNLTIRDGITNGDGGGIHLADHSNNVLDGVIITGNSASAAGGGVGLGQGAFLTLQNSTISGNTTTGEGGGIYFVGDGSLFMENSTVSGNGSGNDGGGIFFKGTATSSPPAGFIPNALVLRNSTIYGNVTASASGGGVRAIDFTGTLLVQNSTITNNAAATLAGGGIAESGAGGAITLQNSIVSGNRAVAGPDINADVSVTANFSAIGNGTGFTLSGPSGNNLPFGANLGLSPLGNYGGPTQTVIPGVDSPVFQAGSAALVPLGVATDQRGLPRVLGTVVDIGAVEMNDVRNVTNANDSGIGSLRQTLLDANASAGFDTIYFSPTFFNTPRTISLLTALPTLTGKVTIFGPGKGLLAISRAAGAPGFRILDSTATTLNVFGLAILEGIASGPGGGGGAGPGGGGIQAQGTAPNVTLDSVVLVANSADTGAGGGVRVADGGFLTVRNSTVVDNSANGGGGIVLDNAGSLVIENSTVRNNAAGVGAGVYFLGNAVAANPPLGFTPSVLIVRNTTIANNTASGGNGGGISVSGSGAILIQNATITGNSASAGGGVLLTDAAQTTLSIANSIVAGNTAGIGPDISASNPINANFCAIGSGAGFSLSETSDHNLAAGTNLMLGPLADNGGPTQTILPQPGSPLINAGSSALVAPGFTRDQRGFARILGTSVDIGAVETGTPFVASSTFVFDTQQRLEITFNENVQPSLSLDDLVVVNSDTSGVVPSGNISFQYFAAFNLGVFVFNGNALADGNYRATVASAGVTNPAGVQLGADGVLDFFVLAGDANRDRTVNTADFTILASNFNKTVGMTFSTGDFNYDGKVNALDFNALATRFGTTLAAPSASAPLASTIPLMVSAQSIPNLFSNHSIRDELQSEPPADVLTLTQPFQRDQF